jgi:hypothetical protein
MGKIDTIVRYSPLEIPKIIRAHYNAEPKVPVNFIAEPSTVKSDGAFQAASEISESEGRQFFDWNKHSLQEKQDVLENPKSYFVFADLRASETDIGELRLQDMKNGKDYITFKYNILFEALSHSDAKGVLFFDEMNLAPNMIKAQFYKIINDQAVGDIPLSTGVLCVSAGNEAEHSRGVTEDPVPLVLRRGNYFLRPLTAEEYTDYAVRSNHHQYVIGYLGFQPHNVHSVQYDLPDGVGQPCPRTWTKLSAILKANKLSVPEVEMIATGLIGQGVGKEFAAFVKSAQNINLNDLIKNPNSITKLEDNLSLVYAAISGIVERFRDDKGVLSPAVEISLALRKPELGAYLLRAIKNVDERAFMKAATNSKQLAPDLAKRMADRFAKYLVG